MPTLLIQGTGGKREGMVKGALSFGLLKYQRTSHELKSGNGLSETRLCERQGKVPREGVKLKRLPDFVDLEAAAKLVQ